VYASRPRPEFAQVRYYLTEVTDETAVDPADNLTRTVARGEWRSSTSWPPPDGTRQRLFVSEAGLGGEPLIPTPRSIPVEADAAVPSQGGGNLTTPAGPYDQAKLDMRQDILVLATTKASEPVEVVGSPRAQLWISSATSDLDVVVRLEVLTATGKAIALTDGVRRGRFARGFDAIRALTPGEPTLFEVELGPLALRLMPGQALRIAISGSSSPRYEPNPNVATPLVQRPQPVSTTLSLHSDVEHTSQLVLPVASGMVPGAQAIEEEPEADGGLVEVDGGLDAGSPLPSPSPDAAITGEDAATAEPEPVRGGADGCSCSSAPGPTRIDGGLVLMVGLALARRRRRAREAQR
jgi:putative CocE/NonD family hydrolase